jgi:hypothetical protein
MAMRVRDKTKANVNKVMANTNEGTDFQEGENPDLAVSSGKT